MMLKALLLLLLLAVVQGQMGNNANVAVVLNSIFGPPPKTVTKGGLIGRNGPSTIVPPISSSTGGIFGTPATTVTEGPSTVVPLVISNTGGEDDLSCKMEDGTIGQCVNFYLCDTNNTINDDGVGIIDIRAGEGPCASYLDICCLPRDVRPPDKPITPRPPPAKPGCGWSNPNGADMMTTGETNGETKFGEFPWMVAILKKLADNEIGPNGQKLEIYVGGGSLIAPNVVLTGAHIAISSPLKIRAGEWDTANTKEIHLHQDRDVASVEIHKDSNRGNLHNDIGLLFLSEPVTPAPNVGVVCLPPPQMITPANTRCFATGWGKDKFDKEGQYQSILKKIELPVVERNACQTALRKTRLGRFFKLHTSFMCAGGEKGKDTCKGDGGSPLSCPISGAEDRYMLSGMVAWGIGCGEDGIPSVYVDVSSMREWINEKIVSKGLDPKTYTI